MSAAPRTDREKSLAAEEFVWDTDGETNVHGFVTVPIVRQLRQQGAQRVLDLGCGNGYFTGALAEQGFQMAGMDFSLSGVERARRKHSDVEFLQHDVTQPLPRDHHDRYDAVIAVEVIEHLLLPRKLLENARDALRPGGLFLLTTPYHGYLKNLALALTNKFDDHWHPLRDFGHVKFFSKATILTLMQEYGFTDARFETVGRIPALARSMIVSGRKPVTTE